MLRLPLRSKSLPPTQLGAVKRFDVLQAVASIRKTAVHRGVELDDARIERLVDFAERSQCIVSDGQQYSLAQLRQAKLMEGSPVAIARVDDPFRSPDVSAIAYDELLLRTVTTYLGYVPSNARPRLFWSFPVECSLEQRRRQNQTVEFHFDIDGLNFVYASFYLLRTSASNGAHVMVLGSHHRKPLRWLLSTARRSDEEILGFYGLDSIVTIEGPPGYGFIQDTSCYHKALAPLAGERLLLQIRYS